MIRYPIWPSLAAAALIAGSGALANAQSTSKRELREERVPSRVTYQIEEKLDDDDPRRAQWSAIVPEHGPVDRISALIERESREDTVRLRVDGRSLEPQERVGQSGGRERVTWDLSDRDIRDRTIALEAEEGEVYVDSLTVEYGSGYGRARMEERGQRLSEEAFTEVQELARNARQRIESAEERYDDDEALDDTRFMRSVDHLSDQAERFERRLSEYRDNPRILSKETQNLKRDAQRVLDEIERDGVGDQRSHDDIRAAIQSLEQIEQQIS